MQILVTGATGLVGRRLVEALRGRGDTVIALSRRGGEGYLKADATVEGAWVEELAFVDAVVHLAGAGVFDRRWTLGYKAEIVHSRVTSTAILAGALARNPLRKDGTPKVFVSASAVGYYGDRGEPCGEEGTAGVDFLADVCVQWEAAAVAAKHAGVRVVHPRIGIVLDAKGGALPQLSRPFRYYLGGPIASGRQGMSWIHHQDLTRILLFALDNPQLAGPINAVSPGAVSNREFCKTLGRVLRKPCWLPVPKFALRLAVGEGAAVLAAGQYAQPRVLQQAGFVWCHPILEAALADVLQQESPTR